MVSRTKIADNPDRTEKLVVTLPISLLQKIMMLSVEIFLEVLSFEQLLKAILK
jgi:hypothetical protein